MKKLTLLLSAMLFSMMSFAAVVTFDADTDKGNAGTDSNNAAAYTITKDGVTVTVSSGILGTYSGEMHYRIYKNQTLTVTSTVGAITSVEFTCTAKNDAKYGPGCFTWSVGNYTYADEVGTWTGSAAEVVFTASSNQVRATQIIVAIDGSVIPDNGGDTGDDTGGDDNGGTVLPPAEGVITCAEAVEICKATGETATTETYTIRGYVTEIKEAYTTQYKNVSCWMADEKGGGQVFLAFRVKPTTDADQAVKVNDYIEVKGNLVNYSGNTPETTAGGSMTIITAGEEAEKPSLPEGLTGDGTKENPFTIEDVMTLNNQFAGPYYVKAFIVGQVNGAAITTGAEFDAPFSPSTNTDGTVNTYNTNLLVAASADVNDVAKCVPVQLPAGDLRTNFNLPENPEMDGKEVLICGTLTAYFKVPGIKNTSSIELLTPQDPNLVTINGLEFADAYYVADDNAWLIYLYPETEDFSPEVHTNLTLLITSKSSTAINGTYDLQAAMYFVSETDLVSGFDSSKPASVTIKNVDEEGNYSFVGSFVGEDAKTYTFDQVVNVYAIDSDTEEEIVLEETNTAVENVYVGENPVKFIENGQLMIIRGENVYNVLGAQVK